jgi:cardiolipin synthase
VVLLLLGGADSAAVVVFALAAVTDFFDGRLARRSGGRPTYVGRILDPVADRLMLSSVAVALAARGFLPVWVVAVLVGRDALALLGSLVVGSRIRVNRVGKAATAVLMFSVALIVFGSGKIGVIVFYIGLGLSLLSGGLYIASISRILDRKGAR